MDSCFSGLWSVVYDVMQDAIERRDLGLVQACCEFFETIKFTAKEEYLTQGRIAIETVMPEVNHPEAPIRLRVRFYNRLHEACRYQFATALENKRPVATEMHLSDLYVSLISLQALNRMVLYIPNPGAVIIKHLSSLTKAFEDEIARRCDEAGIEYVNPFK